MAKEYFNQVSWPFEAVQCILSYFQPRIVFNALWVIFTAEDRLIFFIFRLGLFYDEGLLIL